MTPRYSLLLEQSPTLLVVEADTLGEAIAQAEADSGRTVMLGQRLDD